MITTRNRCEDLRKTLSCLMSCTPQPSEILVCADGCDDETVHMVTGEFPSIRLLENSPSIGSVSSRRRLLEETKSDWVLSLDDDSYPLDQGFFEKISSVIANHPEAAVITFPEQHDGGTYVSADKAPDSPGHYVSSYANCGAIMDRRFYLAQQGFPAIFSHMYEEPDYALQCYAAGSSVWFEPSLVIRHHQSPHQRNHLRRHQLNARNELWSVWMRCPWPWLPLVTAFRMWSQFRYAVSEGFGWAVREPLYWIEALKNLGSVREARQPVPWKRYFTWMRLARRPLYSRDQLNGAFGSSKHS